MALDTDLSRKPYFDDYEVSKNFYRVLYRPAAAVQARELNQMQTILQDQIDKFGRHIFKDGSVVEGCAFTFDNSYNYVKIKDSFANNLAISNINEFVGKIAVNSNGLRGRVVNVIGGYESEDPNLNTLYVKYLNSSTFANGVQQSNFVNNETVQIQTDSAINIGNVVVATTSNSTGKGYAFSTTEGVIFKKGFFIRVEPQTLIVSRYNNAPDQVSVGFEAEEEIITPEIDTSLLDNAAGSPNQNAPGAHRLKLVPSLVVRNTVDIANTTTFFSLCDFKDGLPVSIKNDPQYAALAKDMARRTFETNGDYIVNPFLLSTEKKYTYQSNTANVNYLSIVSTPGIGYVKGYRVEFINNNTADLRKGTDFATVTNQLVTANFGYYFNVNEFVGDFNTDGLAQVQLHSAAKTAVTNNLFLGTSYTDTTIIGTAYVRGVAYDSSSRDPVVVNATFTGTISSTTLTVSSILSGAIAIGQVLTGSGVTAGTTITGGSGNVWTLSASSTVSTATAMTASTTPGFTYRLYVFNVQMNPGQKLSDVRSVIYYVSSTQRAIADIVLDKDFTGTNIAKIQESAGETMIYPFGQKAIKPDGFSNTSYVYRNRGNSNFVGTTGLMTLPIVDDPGANEQFNYGVGTLSQASETSFVVTPISSGYSNFKTGNVTVTGTTVANSTATATLFQTEYAVGDYIYVGSQSRKIVSIANNLSMTIDATVSATNLQHQKTWQAGVPINFFSTSRTITIDDANTATISLGEAANANFSASVYFDVLRSETLPLRKIINRSTYVKIQANSNPGGTTGPWCLGIPDVFKLNAVYVDQAGGNTYLTTNPNLVTSFRLDNGQRDSYYGLSYISSATPVAPNATLLVSVDNFTYDTSSRVGFFTAASYPIDDANTANAAAIQTYQIPQYTSTIGTLYDLRDSVDFRPFVNSTANATASTIASATINPSGTLTMFSYAGSGSYVPSPGTNYQSSIQYYLPRKDRISLTTGGDILVTEGAADLNPAPPPEVPGTMTIGIATVSPYPSLTPTEARAFNRYDYAVQTSILQTKRFTMADIGKINKRIDRLEYYTSLSLLEQATTSLLVRSGDTGQNRFKNGILVDPFKNHTIGNTNDSAYRISIDEVKTEARPFFRQQTIGMRFDPAASTAVDKNGIIMLPHTSNNVNQQQPFASKYRNCIEGNILQHRGTVVLDPPGILDSDITQGPVINSNLDLSSNFVNLSNSLKSMFGTQYGNWSDYGTGQVVGQQSSDNITGIGYIEGQHGQVQEWQRTTTTTLAQERQQISKSFAFQSTETSIELGNYVSNVSIQPFVPARQIFFYARGMKPNTVLRVYLDGIAMNQNCLPLTPYTGTLTLSGGNSFTDAGKLVYFSRNNGNFQFNSIADWGAALNSDASGNVYGILAIPAGLFKSGELEFRITDITDLTIGESAVTTQASTTLFCSALSVQKNKSSLQIRSGTINIEEQKLNQTVYRDVVTTNTWQYLDPNIPNPYGVPEDAPPPITQISESFDFPSNET